ncbi:MAG: cytochrome c [Bosea sp. (in: a-proteobacteria)]|uniref:c-type cytochrome n=1 Tax=Bosea sp. (in: a-proteobacteria) TaxID=1871050 RepID=UPI0027351EB1|nr:cytochrome c [Bosea sp. (in: a-proteobacteria)]MDP3599963.1 cytochrome c [Bosea sp. (in: a-proteobacteria)]
MLRLRRLLVTLVLLAAVGLGGFYLLTDPRIVSPSPQIGALGAADLENGRILFAAGGCASCHATPNQDDKLRLGGGLALESPFGTFHAPNISPHTRDGIGNWGVQDFVDAMAAGVSPRGQHYYPSFPYTSYRLMPPKALADLFAYIRTLTPVEGRAPAHDLPFPFNIRRIVGGWKLLFFEGAAFQPDPSKSEEWNRGAYLVNGPGHCAECHSNRNALGAIIAATRFAGGPDPEGKGFVPNITQTPEALGKWSKGEIAELLKSGFTPSFDSVGGTMAAVVRNTAQLPEADRQAMAEYLKSLPAVQGPPRPVKTGG